MDAENAAAAESPTQTPPPLSTAVTVAAASPQSHQTLTLALPIQQRSSASNGAAAAEPWSPAATSALIDAWAHLYLHLSRGFLNQTHWQQVADAVNSAAVSNSVAAPKSIAQCKSRIDSLKKKYRSERSKIASSQLKSSSWPFYNRFNLVLGLNPNPNNPNSNPTPNSNPSLSTKRPRSSPPPPVPPPTAKGPAEEVMNEMVRFGEVYERVEMAKAKAEAEMEKKRMGFVKEMEIQRMQFLFKLQLEFAKIKRRTRR